ncbi:ribonuclease HIII [Candidatus Phytoplasma phoenicium]|uniref:Ribonuclease HIII n=1 Tax=Candidatus Phytoplasma phoenicium TaxID=198422 RepID=A0A2S8NT73_9MOLU|nr:ribonuclease HIII [Candidatus Phytoplasma phoenicium]
MNHFYTLKLNLSQMHILKQNYKETIIKSKFLYIFFTAQKKQRRITCFHNGACLIQGKESAQEMFYIKKLVPNLESPSLNAENFDVKNQNIIGSDEVGTGDFFGPIVVCCVFTNPSDRIFLEQIGVKDSKRLSTKDIYRIANLTMNKISYCYKILSPKEYNCLIQNNNLNKIKALLHNEIILKLLKKIKTSSIVVLDQFATPSKYFDYLKDTKPVYKDINFQTQAEQKYLSVALASIIARYLFLEEIKKLSHKMNLILKLGAGHLVDRQITEIYQMYGISCFKNIAKYNFKNLKKTLYFSDLS